MDVSRYRYRECFVGDTQTQTQTLSTRPLNFIGVANNTEFYRIPQEIPDTKQGTGVSAEAMRREWKARILEAQMPVLYP